MCYYPCIRRRYAVRYDRYYIHVQTSHICGSPYLPTSDDWVLQIPKEPMRGSHFGRCTCGVDRLDSAPCAHMAAVAASSRLPGVTRHNIMSYWWTRAHWRMQFPLEALGVTNVSMSSIISDNVPDHNLRYCPEWTANQKARRPKKDKRKTSVLKSATGSNGMKRATGVKRARRYCHIRNPVSATRNHNYCTADISVWPVTISVHLTNFFLVITIR
jgi:hypothetical protein